MEDGRRLIILLRHGERSDEAPVPRRVEFSCDSDAPLTRIGLDQSELAAQAIIKLIPEGSSIHLVSSPLIRCLETASKLAMALNLPIYMEEGFGECYQIPYWDYNPFDNSHLKNDPEMIREKLGHVTLIENSHITRPKYIETEEESEERIGSVFPQYLKSIDENVIIICTHNLPLKIMTRIMGGNVNNFHSNYTLISAAYMKDDEFTIIKEFDVSHLPKSLQKPISL